MKLVTYDGGQGPRLGLIANDSVIDIAEASNGALPADMRSFLEIGDAALQQAQALTNAQGRPLSEVRVMAPILNPSKIVAIGLNYMDHCREQGVQPPKRPTTFTKFTSSIIGPGDEIRWNPELTQKVDWEVELAVVIGKRARNVSEADALDYVAGYTICHDVSARDLQLEKGDQWIVGKSLDTFCPLGPVLTTKDEMPDPHTLSLRCLVNGKAMQNSNTKELIFKIPFLIEFLTRGITLLPGDVITTGTPDGVGNFLKPPLFLKDGDEVTVEIDGIGSMTNRCVEER
ncbi:MAG: fumarylacetoacetate hydrolase family protein [Caldilineaceae bacterium]|nr:fumarylacetoacetate hydrolase family protein [Caldilineaceae bacterium]